MNTALVLAVVASCLACGTRDNNAQRVERDGSAQGRKLAEPTSAVPSDGSSDAQAGSAAAPQARIAPRTASPTASFYGRFAHPPPPAVLMRLGGLLFADPGLSASGTLACASCHDPAHAFAPSNARAIQGGGRNGKQLGFRAAPSLRYLATLPRFGEHSFDDETGVDGGPTGGFMWDGRAATTHDQARLPLFAPFEMANRSPAELAARLRRAPYAGELRDAFGAMFATDDGAVDAAVLALEVFQQSRELAPFDSKFDWVLRGKAQLTARELHGFQLFNAAGKGNCASCHPSTSEHGAPLFTDFGFVALGLPRARAIPANADPAFHDLGLCGPLRRDLADRPEYCGLFRTPSLRNVATRRRLFHNGSFTSLTEAVRFYATRDVAPKKWYPRDRSGRVRVFDDLPEPYRKNVNMDPPFGGKPGDRPPLDDAEIADIVAFLGTLTDGYRP